MCEYSGGVPASVDLKTAKEATVTLKARLTDFGEFSATVPLKMQ